MSNIIKFIIPLIVFVISPSLFASENSVDVLIRLKKTAKAPQGFIIINGGKKIVLAGPETKDRVELPANASKITAMATLTINNKNIHFICKETPVTEGTNIITINMGSLNTSYPTCVIWTYNIK